LAGKQAAESLPPVFIFIRILNRTDSQGEYREWANTRARKMWGGFYKFIREIHSIRFQKGVTRKMLGRACQNETKGSRICRPLAIPISPGQSIRARRELPSKE
jgi:hypothetical protein